MVIFLATYMVQKATIPYKRENVWEHRSNLDPQFSIRNTWIMTNSVVPYTILGIVVVKFVSAFVAFF